jgi:hypothetical protein
LTEVAALRGLFTALRRCALNLLWLIAGIVSIVLPLRRGLHGRRHCEYRRSA